MESVLLHLREDGKPLDVGATGQTNVELPGGEGFRVDGAAIEGKTLGLMDGDGVSKLEGDLRELAYRVGSHLVFRFALRVDELLDNRFEDLSRVSLNLHRLVRIGIKGDRHARLGAFHDRALRAVDIFTFGVVDERHDAGTGA